MSGLLPFLITGLVAGSLYGVAGIGLVLTYRTSGVFNFAHGGVAAAAAFAFSSAHDDWGWPWPVAAAFVVLVFGVVGGWVLERLTRALAGAPDAITVVATVGLLLAIEGTLFLVYGPITRSAPAFLPTSGFVVDGVTVSWAQVISFVVAGVGALGLFLILQRSRLGLSMRAVVDNPTLASLSGERTQRVRLAGWCIGAATAAVSGILLAPTLNLDVQLLALLVVQAFGACAIGRFTSFPLTFAGGLAVGVSASLLTRWLSDPPWSGLPASAPFLILIGVLLVVPLRLLPHGPSVRRSVATAVEPWPARRILLVGLPLAIGLLVVPHVVGTKLPVWTSGLAYVVVFGSLGLLTWASGQLSLCHAAFLAVGATTMSHLTGSGVPWLPALLLAGLAVVPVGAMVAIPAVRLTGLYLGLVTLGFGILMQNVAYRTAPMFGSGLIASVPRPVLGPFDGHDDATLYYLVLAIALVSTVAMSAMWGGRLGRLLRGLAEAPTMLATHGLDVTVTRLIVFCTSAFFAGIGGALLIAQTGSASAITFGPIQSLLLLAVLVMSGTSRVRSPMIAALSLGVLPGYATDLGFERQLLVFGTIALLAATYLARRHEVTRWFAAARGSVA